MKLTLKTMSNKIVNVDIEDTSTVLDLKNKTKDSGYNPEQIKLIYSGKILANDKELSFYNLKDNSVIILMEGKKITPSIQPTPATITAPQQNIPIIPTNNIPLNNAIPNAQLAPTIIPIPMNNLQSLLPLMMAGGNGNQANLSILNSLFNFLPAGANNHNHNHDNDGEDDSTDDNNYEEDSDPNDNTDNFDEQTAGAISSQQMNPAQMNQLLSILMSLNGNNPLAGHNPYANNMVAPELTAEENKEVDELMTLGFSRNQVVEAFIICNKDKNLAASYLFENS